MKLEGLTANISFAGLCDAACENLTNEQKLILAKKCAYYGDMIDMSYIEDLIVMAAKVRLKAIKKNRALYNRNRPYFKALKTIIKQKSAE